MWFETKGKWALRVLAACSLEATPSLRWHREACGCTSWTMMLDCVLCNDFAEKWVALPCGHVHSTECIQSATDAPQAACPICEVAFDCSCNYGIARPLRLPHHATSPDKDDHHGASPTGINKRLPLPSAFEDKIAVLEREEKLLTAELEILEKERLFLDMLSKIKHPCRPDGTPVLRYFAQKKRKKQTERLQANVSLWTRSLIWYGPNALLLITIYAADVSVALTISIILWAAVWGLIIILGRVLND